MRPSSLLSSSLSSSSTTLETDAAEMTLMLLSATDELEIQLSAGIKKFRLENFFWQKKFSGSKFPRFFFHPLTTSVGFSAPSVSDFLDRIRNRFRRTFPLAGFEPVTFIAFQHPATQARLVGLIFFIEIKSSAKFFILNEKPVGGIFYRWDLTDRSNFSQLAFRHN